MASLLPLVGTQLESVLDRSNFLAAFGHVAENGGCHGADGVTIGEFRERLVEELDFLEASVRRRVYVPFPLLRIEVPKRSGHGVRVLAIPTVRDRVLQTAVDRIVRPIFEAEFETSSFAYRQGRSHLSPAMLILVSYDIPDDRRRTKIASLLKDFGERVQYSVFECLVNEAALDRLRQRLVAKVVAEDDSVRIYRLCADCRGKVEILGKGMLTEDPEVYVI